MTDMIDAGGEKAAASADAAAEETAAAAPAQTAAPAQVPDWMTGLPEALRGDATLSRYDSIEKLASAHVEAKRALSAKGILAPKGPDDAEGLAAALKALGAPETADAYGISVPEGGDPALAEGFGKIALKAGLLPGQVNTLLDFWSGYAAEVDARTAAAAKQQWEADETELRTEWAASYDANIEAARRAARMFFDVDGPALDALNSALGSAALLKGFAKIGALVGEDTPVGLSSGQSPAVTPATAQAQLDALLKDRAFMAKVADGDDAALERWRALNAAAARRAAA